MSDVKKVDIAVLVKGVLGCSGRKGILCFVDGKEASTAGGQKGKESGDS